LTWAICLVAPTDSATLRFADRQMAWRIPFYAKYTRDRVRCLPVMVVVVFTHANVALIRLDLVLERSYIDENSCTATVQRWWIATRVQLRRADEDRRSTDALRRYVRTFSLTLTERPYSHDQSSCWWHWNAKRAMMLQRILKFCQQLVKTFDRHPEVHNRCCLVFSQFRIQCTKFSFNWPVYNYWVNVISSPSFIP